MQLSSPTDERMPLHDTPPMQLPQLILVMSAKRQAFHPTHLVPSVPLRKVHSFGLELGSELGISDSSSIRGGVGGTSIVVNNDVYVSSPAN
jgi:hypothetical protein